MACAAFFAGAGEVYAERADPAEKHLQLRLEEILRHPILDDARIGVHIRDVANGRTLFERNSGKLFNPASNMKILTTAAALHYLGPGYRFRTTVFRDRALALGVLKGNLYVRGGGDPTLTSERLFGLVNQIAMSGLEKIDGDLVIDAGFFDDVYEGPGWEQEETDQSYAPPVGALSVNYGNFTIRVMPGDRLNRPAAVSVWPEIPGIELISQVRTAGRRTRPRIFIGTTKRTDDGVRVTVRGRMPMSHGGLTYYRRMHHPTMYAGQVLKRMLELRGIEITGKIREGERPQRGVTHVVTFVSKPLADIVNTLNKYSNNFIAEQILKTLGAEMKEEPGTWQKGCAVLGEFLEELGVEADSFVMGNGSGLNDTNRLTPSQLTRVLEVMHKRFELRPEFVASLAVAGVSGTIGSRFSDSAAVKRLRAKTGSLTGVSALSGYVAAKDDRLIAFSVMMNDYPGRARDMWRIQDDIGTVLAEFEAANYIARP